MPLVGVRTSVGAPRGTPSFEPVTTVYSRTCATTRCSSHPAVIRSTRAGSPQTKAWGARSPGQRPVIGWASLKTVSFFHAQRARRGQESGFCEGVPD